jgi:hypothetical protein
MSGPTLSETLNKIIAERQLTQKVVVKAMSLGMGTFYGWRKSPDSASVNTLRKIRDFTENPDKFLSNSGVTAKKPQRTITSSTGVGLTSAECLAISEMSSSDLEFSGEIMQILNCSNITVEQIKQLAELRDVKPIKE